MLWRHGDVFIATVPDIPARAVRRPNHVLAYGEVTGHSHRIAEAGVAEVWEAGQDLFLKVTADAATVVHQEHKPITLPRGTYRVWQQREYTPQEIRRVLD